MTFSLEFCVLTCIAVMLGFISEADQHPQLKQLSIEWLDNFTVNVSWEKPSSLKNCSEVLYESHLTCGDKVEKKKTPATSFTDVLLTEDLGSDHLTYNICLENTSDCVTKTIHAPRYRDKVVKDFKCFISSEGLNCSWIPVNNSQHLEVFYRECRNSAEYIKTTRPCESSGKQNGCYVPSGNVDTCILVKTATGKSTFRPVLAVHPPKLHITDQEEKLSLNWTSPKSGAFDCWACTICYTKCNESQRCRNTSEGETTLSVPYEKHCLYKFRIKTWSAPSCPTITSVFSEPVTYGFDEPPDRTQTVVVIVIPIILFLCVILSFYCLRRHSAIICPIVPDPSAIFKEMMMNGNKDYEATTGGLYIPMPEPIEPCKIILESENSPLQQNL